MRNRLGDDIAVSRTKGTHLYWYAGSVKAAGKKGKKPGRWARAVIAEGRVG